MTGRHEIEEKLNTFVAGVRQQGKSWSDGILAFDAQVGEYNKLNSEAGATDRQKINSSKAGSFSIRLKELAQEIEFACNSFGKLQ